MLKTYLAANSMPLLKKTRAGGGRFQRQWPYRYYIRSYYFRIPKAGEEDRSVPACLETPVCSASGTSGWTPGAAARSPCSAGPTPAPCGPQCPRSAGPQTQRGYTPFKKDQIFAVIYLPEKGTGHQNQVHSSLNHKKKLADQVPKHGYQIISSTSYISQVICIK